jgi:hypothetical protein
MKKFLTSILLLTTLCSGSSFAWDTHPASAFGFDAVGSAMVVDIATNGDHAHELTDGGLSQDDHCSHATAHLLGIFYNAPLKMQNAVSNYRVLSSIIFPYLYISPLLRPPIA